jgi:transglycosylase-like protein with SLT domain
MAVPSAGQYQKYIDEAAKGTGIPEPIVAAQAYDESGFNPGATSSAGAEGFWQFLPSTYNSVAKQAGVPPGTEYNVADETKAYIVYMDQLLKEEGGSIYKALEAYNAGPGNLTAGAGYASSILSAAGASSSATAGKGTGTGAVATGGDSGSTPATTTGITSILDPSTWVNDIINVFLKGLGLGSIKDLLQRLGLILLGVALILVGIRILTGGSNKQTFNFQMPQSKEEESSKSESKAPRQKRSPVAKTKAPKAATNVGASEAVEAAAVAL